MFILMPDYDDMPLIFCSSKTYCNHCRVRMLSDLEKNHRH